jgi:23S rRNA (adenine2503-C2)-methyltransferase
MLKKLLTEETHYIDQLYLSLHASDQKKRVEIIPMGKTNPIDKLVQTGADFARRVGRPTIASYLLLKGFNDSDQDAANLLQLVNHEHYRIQILLFNPIFGLPFVRVTEEKADAFCEKLKRGGLDAYVTLSRGRDIDGGCGQLRMKRLSQRTGRGHFGRLQRSA